GGIGSGTRPIVANATAQTNQYNVLSSLVKASVSYAVKVQVTYTAESGASSSTPEVPVTSLDVSVPVLGLKPNTNYTFRITAIGADGTRVDSDGISFRTGTLPSTLPTFTVTEQAGSEPGFTMIALIQDILSPSDARIAGPLIVDHTGAIVWYREAFEGPVIDWQRQPDGTYTAAINNLYLAELGYTDARYFQMDNVGNVLRSYFALGAWGTDAHELRLQPNGDALLYANNGRNMDLTPWGGQPSVDVYGNILERISPNGQLLFAWNTLDQLDIGSADPLILQGLPDAASLDFTHGNAIDVMADGAYMMSFRHLSQLIKVDHTGSIVWKLGGVDGDFSFVNDPLDGFSFQHGARELPNGNILLFDNGNGHNPQHSRAVEYRLDVNAGTATLVWQYVPDPPIFGAFMGFTQRLANGNTLIDYGARSVVQEVNAAGQLIWELRGPTTDGFYRAFRIPSLY
ncbi:MAG TPA: arylsulfotransferase family protein, partial [Myxococcaceae bacterium]|nr:arylsulfotransferase family protein [Myxococcaceae bacterium]